jgi:hypothetical protein
MQSPRPKGVLIGRSRTGIQNSSSSTLWVGLAAGLCLLLYVSAYVFAGQKSTSVSGRNVLVAIPRREWMQAGVKTTKATEMNWDAASATSAAAQDVDVDVDVKDPEKENQGQQQTSDDHDGDYGDYTYEDPGPVVEVGDDVDYDYENADENQHQDDSDMTAVANPVPLRLHRRADDGDEEYRRRWALDPTLNPGVTTELVMKAGWVDTPFDEFVTRKLEEDRVTLHQTWKEDCVLSSRIKYMKSWLKNEPTLQVLFWTDSSMEDWVRERFEGTQVWLAWQMIGNQERMSTIKKADMFRAMAMWYYGGVYADLDIELKESVLPFIMRRETVIVWEPEWAMEQTWAGQLGQYMNERGQRRTLMLSAFVVSGRRYADFLGYYVNWIVANTLSGRSNMDTHVLDHTGPIAEAEAYWYYVGRLQEHDALLRVLPYEEFQRWGEHYTEAGESTWEDGKGDGPCRKVTTIYGDRVTVY